MVIGWQLDFRLSLIRLLIAAAFIFLGASFSYVQVIQHDRFVSLSQGNRIRRVWIAAPRGKILDRNGQVMVDNRPSFDVTLDYKSIKDSSKEVEYLSGALGLEPKEIHERLQKYRGPAYLSVPVLRDIDLEKLTLIEESRYEMPSVSVDVTPVRDYVLGTKASGILGYVGAISQSQYQDLKNRGYHWLDVIGKVGIESSCEAFLKGASGGMQVEVDHRGHREQVLSIKKAVPGRDVFLTIDLKVQEAMEEVLEGKIGAGIAVDPRTGEILASVSKPDYDLNIFIKPQEREKVLELMKDPLRPLTHKVFQGLYSPGSIFKLVVAMAGLDSGLIQSDSVVSCDGALQVGGRIFHCWRNGGHSDVNTLRAIQQSCNVFFYYWGQRLGPARIAEYSRRLGLGRPTGIDMMTDRDGIVPDEQWKKDRYREIWYGGDTANFAVGQGFITVTPIQVAMMVSAIANGGHMMRPYLVKKVTLPEGRTLVEMGPKIISETGVSEKVLETLRRAMRMGVNEPGGTGRLAKLENVEVCGKTGTVQVKKGEGMVKNGWFVSFAPFENPRIVLVLLVEGVESGGQDVAPLARQIMEVFFQ